jgi:hypothetical protein
MMNHASPAPWNPPASTTTLTRAAFATLDRGQQRLLESLLFDGQTCTQIAHALGTAATDVRSRAGAAILELHAASTARDAGCDRGAVATMLALRALDALDPDEAELIDVMLDHQPAHLRAYAEYCALVGELCTMVPRIAPPPGVLARLLGAIGDDTAAN